jgi:hypothetical protein
MENFRFNGEMKLTDFAALRNARPRHKHGPRASRRGVVRRPAQANFERIARALVSDNVTARVLQRTKCTAHAPLLSSNVYHPATVWTTIKTKNVFVAGVDQP